MEFGKRIGWARMGLLVSAVLLVIFAVICLVAHEILPEALHNPQLPEGYTWPAGELIGMVVMLVAGISQIAAFKMAGGSKNLSGWLIISGIMAIADAIMALVDPWLGTYSFEWVIALAIAMPALGVFFGACAAKGLGYKMWLVEIILCAVMIGLALGVALDSSMAATMCGLACLAYAVIVALPALKGDDVKLAC